MGGERTKRRSRLRPRKIITQVIVFLLLVSGGAVVNVAVAWGIAVWVDPFADASLTTGYRRVGGEYWCVEVIQGAGTLNARSDRADGVDAPDTEDDPGPEVLSPPWSGFQMPSADFAARISERDDRIVDAKGWPKLTLWYESQTPDRMTITGILGGIEIGGHWDPGELGEWTVFPKALPLRPIWSGFIVNTLFYAIILWLLIPGPFVLCRLIRLKRGRCPKCGYDLRGQLPGAGRGCPECGWNRQPEGAT